jgi:hypothetical protein
MADESRSDSAQFAFMELLDGCLKELIKKPWSLEPPVVSEEMAKDPYVQTFLAALAHVKATAGTDGDEVVVQEVAPRPGATYARVGTKNKTEDLRKLQAVGRQVTAQEWKDMKSRAVTVSAFLDKDLPVESYHCKSSFKQIYQKRLKEEKMKELVETNTKAPLREQNLYVGFVYMPEDRVLMLRVLDEELAKFHEKLLKKAAKETVKTENIKDEPGVIKVKKEHLKKPKKEEVETIDLWEL